jgi:hypothetical protein
MEFEFEFSKKDFVNFYKHYLKDGIRRRAGAIILLSLFFMVCQAWSHSGWQLFLVFLFVYTLVIFGLIYYLPLFVIIIRLKSLIAKKPSYFEHKKLTVLDQGLKIESASKTDIFNWESMKDANINSEFIYIVLINKKIIPVPKYCFKSEAEATNCIGMIQTKIFKSKGTIGSTNFGNISKPSYALGLLCLIPLIGAIAGIVFIINGVFKYKDKWFVIIGCAGVLFTVALYGSLFYSTTTISFKKGFVPLTQQQLNSVLKGVEFYKIKNGTYPDSLEQINKDNSDISIWEPLQFNRKSNKAIDFNYQKVGDHYYLFSSGIDGIPNTKDDIYPQVAKTDSAKFGLIHK